MSRRLLRPVEPGGGRRFLGKVGLGRTRLGTLPPTPFANGGSTAEQRSGEGIGKVLDVPTISLPG
jgi:hypothetical protein